MSKVIWSSDMTYNYWANEAPDDEVLEYAEDYYNCDCGEEDFVEHDKDGNVVSCDYDGLRDWLCERSYDSWRDMDFEDFEYNFLPGVVKQLNDDMLIIDGELIHPENNYNRHSSWLGSIGSKIEGYYGNAEIEVNDDEEVIGWYTMPSDESHLYRLIRHIPEIKEEVDRELDSRLEEEDEDYYGYDGATGRELWLAVYDEYDKDDIDWEAVEEYLVPIMNPYL